VLFEEKLKTRAKIYSGRSVGFSADEIFLPNGKTAVREYMEHPGAVAIIPFLDKKNIILVQQYRFPVRKLTFELPAGKLDRGEKIISCAKRELEEETGYRCGKIRKLISFWPTPAFATEIIHIFAATGLVKTKKMPDDDEFLETKTVSFEGAMRMIKNGKIMDSKTIIALLGWKVFFDIKNAFKYQS
jgi:ADP-ribose pyrophosphatase